MAAAAQPDATSVTQAQREPLNPEKRHPDAAGATLCTDCAHAHINRRETPPRCWHPAHGFDVVTGKPYYAKCADARNPRFDDGNRCGPSARWFTPLAADPQRPAAQS